MEKRLLFSVISVLLLLATLGFYIWTRVELVIFAFRFGDHEGLPILGFIGPYIEAGIEAVFGFFASMFVHDWYGLYVIALMAGCVPYLYYRMFRNFVLDMWRIPGYWKSRFPHPTRCLVISMALTFGSYLVFAPYLLYPAGDGLLMLDLLKEGTDTLSSSARSLFFAIWIVHEMMFWPGAIVMLLMFPGALLSLRYYYQSRRNAKMEFY